MRDVPEMQDMQEKVGRSMRAASDAAREPRPSMRSTLLTLAIPLWWAVVAVLLIGAATGWW